MPADQTTAKPSAPEGKHTPGPWRYDKDRCEIVSTTAMQEWSLDPNLTDEPRGVCVISTFGAMGGDDSSADARLIAAAPAMLEALRLAQAYLKTLSDQSHPPKNRVECEEAINAALQLATGEGE